MIDIVINELLPSLQGLPFADTVTGLVRTAVRRIEEGRVSTFPVACNTDPNQCTAPSTYQALTPEDRKKSLLYFESDGYTYDKPGLGGLPVFKARVRLIGWLNLKRLGQGKCSSASAAVASILKAMPVYIEGNTNNAIFNINLLFTGEAKRGASLFGEYSYDEPKTQYLLYPYDSFGMEWEITFQLNKNCLPGLTPGEEDKCNTH